MNRIVLLFALLITSQLQAQEADYRSVIVTAVPFLNIAADARAAALGDMGVATSADVYSLQWNPAKTVFNEKEQEIPLVTIPILKIL